MARLWRVPGGAGGVIGGEVYDWRRYGPGGRTFNNLERRAAARRPQAQPARNNYLAHAQGDAINAILAAAGYNFSLILKWLRDLLRLIAIACHIRIALVTA